MQPPNQAPKPPQEPLPLFRPEAIAAQQHKFYGEILLIRPLSLALLFWMGIGISAVVLGFLLLGTYTDRAKVTGVIVPGGSVALEANLYVPARTIRFVHAGQPIRIRCQSCSGSDSQIGTGTVQEISGSALSPEEIVAESEIAVQEPMYRVKLTLPQPGTEPVPERARLEAELPLGRKPLLKWLFERDSAPSPAKEALAGNAD